MGKGIFTRNYDNIMSLYRVMRVSLTEVVTTGNIYGQGSNVVKDVGGNLRINTYFYSNSYYSDIMNPPFSYMNSTESSSGTILRLGSDNSEETYEDTNLINPLSLDISNTSTSHHLRGGKPVVLNPLTYNEETGCYTKTIRYSFIANQACTIGELGFFYNFKDHVRSSASSTSPEVLVYRRAFETPYNLNKEETISIDFTMSIPANPNQPISIQTEVTTK